LIELNVPFRYVESCENSLRAITFIMSFSVLLPDEVARSILVGIFSEFDIICYVICFLTGLSMFLYFDGLGFNFLGD
jgi:hypothetical protein